MVKCLHHSVNIEMSQMPVYIKKKTRGKKIMNTSHPPVCTLKKNMCNMFAITMLARLKRAVLGHRHSVNIEFIRSIISICQSPPTLNMPRYVWPTFSQKVGHNTLTCKLTQQQFTDTVPSLPRSLSLVLTASLSPSLQSNVSQ